MLFHALTHIRASVDDVFADRDPLPIANKALPGTIKALSRQYHVLSKSDLNRIGWTEDIVASAGNYWQHVADDAIELVASRHLARQPEPGKYEGWPGRFKNIPPAVGSDAYQAIRCVFVELCQEVRGGRRSIRIWIDAELCERHHDVSARLSRLRNSRLGMPCGGRRCPRRSIVGPPPKRVCAAAGPDPPVVLVVL